MILRLLFISSFVITSSSFCGSKSVKVIFNSTMTDSATKMGETKIYVIKKITEKSDFNYSLLNNIDSYSIDNISNETISPVFEPKGGQYRYYQFISTFIGESYNGEGADTDREFHDILILKTDYKNRIIDAYQYTLEWAEVPLQYDLYRASVLNLELKSGMDINQLDFKCTYKSRGDRSYLKGGGILRF